MLLDLHKKFCEIHIPRTGGVARAIALKPWLSAHCRIDLIDRHWTAQEIREQIGADLWDTLYRYAVLRDPREVISSDYRLTLADVHHMRHHGAEFTGLWRRKVNLLASDPSFANFARREYLRPMPPGGLWEHWCRGHGLYRGLDLGVELIPYPELHERWPAICERIGIQHTHPAGRSDRCPMSDLHPCPICFLPETNRSGGHPPAYPRELGLEIDRHFRGDLKRLGLTERLAAVEGG